MTSRRASALAGSALAELYLLARKAGAIDLAVGTPGYPDTPPVLLDEAARALRGPHNQYEDPRGEQRLRENIARGFATPADPDTEITVTVGATEALCVTMLTVIDPGDEVVLLEPYYENFANAVALAGGVPRFVPLRPPDWRWDPAELAAAFGARTRAVIVNTPANPTGRVLTAGEFDEIGALAARWGAVVISDEVYSGLVYDGRTHVSAADLPSMRNNCIVIGSLSKNIAISGWRLGFLRAGRDLTKVLRRVHEVTTNGTAAPLQAAVGRTDVLHGTWWRPAAGMTACRDLAQEMLDAAGLTFHPAEGGCYLLADISGVTELDCRSYTYQTLRDRGVLLVPGSAFFADPGRGDRYVRVAFNRPLAMIRAAASRLSAACIEPVAIEAVPIGAVTIGAVA